MRYLLGIDDTDSRFGHCTTHLGYLIACELARAGCALPTYPRLVRLNPNIPFKTRGNAAVCIEFEADPSRLPDAVECAERLLEAEADVANGANAALVLVPKDPDPLYFRQLYERALGGIVGYKAVIKAVSATEAHLKLLGNGMGIVGAAASLGFRPESNDHTFELLAYRRPENCGTQREVDRASVKEMEADTFPHTFNSYDHESGRVLISPTGPDPVLLGIRGDSPDVVLLAYRRVRVGEDPLGHIVYVTNQCTEAHLGSGLSLPLKAYSSGWLEGIVVSKEPQEGGHLSLVIEAGGSRVVCMVYEPSGDLRRMANQLESGDLLRLCGGVRRATSRHQAVLNVEKIEVISVSGRPARRMLQPGTYLPSPRAQRHLTKQLIRYGNEAGRFPGLVPGWIRFPAGSKSLLPEEVILGR